MMLTKNPVRKLKLRVCLKTVEYTLIEHSNSLTEVVEQYSNMHFIQNKR